MENVFNELLVFPYERLLFRVVKGLKMEKKTRRKGGSLSENDRKGSLKSRKSLFDVLVEPAEELAVPDQRVLGFEDLVRLVLE